MDLTPQLIDEHIAEAKRLLALRKQRRWTPSKLDSLSEAIFAYRDRGASLIQISMILSSKHHVPAHPSTISRWLKKNGG